MNKTSIIVDATKYIGELKEKVERLNQEIGTSQAAATAQNQLPVVSYTKLPFIIVLFGSSFHSLSQCIFKCFCSVDAYLSRLQWKP